MRSASSRRETSSERIPVTLVCVLRGTTLAVPVSRMVADPATGTPLIVNCSRAGIPSAVAPAALTQAIAGDPASFARGLYRALQAKFGAAAAPMQFDRVVVIAAEDVDPVPLAKLLCADAQLSLSCQLESIVAVADADALKRALGVEGAARRDVAIADRLVLQLRATAADCDLSQTRTVVSDINPQLSVCLESIGETSDALAPHCGSGLSEPAPVWERTLSAGAIRAYRVEEVGCLDFARTRRWLTKLCSALGDGLYRLRAVCCFHGVDRLVEFQGFGAVLGPPVFGALRTDVTPRSLITVSGRGLDPHRLASAVRRCNAASVAAEMLRHPGAIY